MSRSLRHIPKPGTLVEVTNRTLQARFLLRPSPELNAVFVGCLAHAREKFPVVVHAATCLSNHFHLLLTVDTSQQLAGFMGLFTGKLSKELTHLHQWPGTVFTQRYRSIVVSDEEEAQIERLHYVLGQGCKEGLVLSPGDWPGVNSVAALLDGRPLRGVWVDRTRNRRTAVELPLAPLPCWAHLPATETRCRVTDLVEQIEAETREMHRREGRSPMGAREACRYHPHRRPEQTKRSPAPRFHAYRKAVRRQLEEGYARFVEAYREAAEQLKLGIRAVFPEDCFPPASPFVPWNEARAPS